jgi:hypothetical protein
MARRYPDAVGGQGEDGAVGAERACAFTAWAATGAMALTGWPEGPPLAPDAPVATRLLDVVDEIAVRTAATGARVDLDLPVVLSGRAAALGLARQGRVSPNGSCRLLRAGEQWIACNLARPEDADAIPAVLGPGPDGLPASDPGPPWADLARTLDSAPPARVEEILDRARLLGLPVARLAPALPARPGRWDPGETWSSQPIAPRHPPTRLQGCHVVDLSSLWAGPMAARVLVGGGAPVVKVESAGRPDGARRGPPSWFRWLHAGVSQVSLDLTDSAGRAELRRLIQGADVIIEASRRRALEQLGAGPTQIDLRPGAVWLSITGHGRAGPEAMWTGFGDDAAVAGGLVAWSGDGPVFCGDAVADPATGLFGALAILRGRAAGGGVLIDLAMSRVAAGLARRSETGCGAAHAVERVDGGWEASCGGMTVAVRPPVPMAPT